VAFCSMAMYMVRVSPHLDVCIPRAVTLSEMSTSCSVGGQAPGLGVDRGPTAPGEAAREAEEEPQPGEARVRASSHSRKAVQEHGLTERDPRRESESRRLTSPLCAPHSEDLSPEAGVSLRDAEVRASGRPSMVPMSSQYPS